MTELIAPPKRTSELVVDRMTELIRSGEWPVGGCIPAEPDLVEQFGVGRNTIREAVRALEHSGMLVPRRGDGTYVSSRNALAGALARVSAARLRDLIGVRRAVEAEAAATAALIADADTVAALRAALDHAERYLAAGDLDRYAKADIDFHVAVVQAAGNHLLVEIYEGVLEVMYRVHHHMVESSLGSGEHPADHARVVDAIEARDAEAARRAVFGYLDIASAGLPS